MKLDVGKAPIHLIPAEVLVEVAKVLDMGREKYGENNWRQDIHETSFSRTYSSAQRHQLQFWMGRDLDDESKLHHLVHAITQLIFLYVQTQDAPETDDRWKQTPSGPDLDEVLSDTRELLLEKAPAIEASVSKLRLEDQT